MSVASTGAFSIGEYPEAVAVMLFYTVGENVAKQGCLNVSQNISRLLDVRPERTDVFREGNYINVSPKEVRTGERIEVNRADAYRSTGFYRKPKYRSTPPP